MSKGKILVQKGTYFQESHISRQDFAEYFKDGVSFHLANGEQYEFNGEEANELVIKRIIQGSKFNKGFYALPKAVANAREDMDEARMDIIGQNGNTGEHYERTIYPGDAKVTINNPDNVVATGIYDDFYDAGICGTPDEDREHREANPCCHENIIPEFQQIRDWAEDKGIFAKGDAKTQYLKLQEEAGEVARAILKDDQPEIIDGLGDTLVVLINLSHLAGYKLEDCLASAYEVIAKRTGKMENGTFVKD